MKIINGISVSPWHDHFKTYTALQGHRGWKPTVHSVQRLYYKPETVYL